MFFCSFSIYPSPTPQQTINAIESDENAERQAANKGHNHATNGHSSNLQRNEGLTLAIPKNDSFSEDVHYRKHPRPLSHMDSKTSPGMMVPRPYNRVVSYQPSISGMSTSHSESDHNNPPPSTDKEKSKHTR